MMITVSSPASLSNLCCGFDILGMALNEPFDTIQLAVKDEPGIVIRHTDNYQLPVNAKENIAGVALQAIIDAMDFKKGFNVVINKQIKPGSGIGSSAASAAGIVVAANELLGKPFSKKQLVSFAMEGEVIASGSRHADNIAPCIYGGLVLIRDTASLDIIQLDAPELFVTIVHPQIEIKTSYARSILPKEIPLKSAVIQWANVAGLVTGFLQKDYGLIGRSLEDVIIEPVRSKLIPGFDEVKQKCLAAGALGGGISGSGPSLFMLSTSAMVATEIENCMKAVYEKLGIEHKTYITGINNEGIKIIS
ncbi:MAG: homoserine kinase [Bacteroidetes bacterium]|nr:homoserine kinase [Bacteroidota bacterium]